MATPKPMLHPAYEAARRRLASTLLSMREARELTQKQLARLTRLQSGQISRVEDLRTDPRLSTIAILAAALGVDVTELFGPNNAGYKPRKRGRPKATLTARRA